MSEAKTKKSFFESRFMRSKIKSNNVSLIPEAALGYLLGPVLALLCNGVINVWLVQYWDKVLGLGELAPLFETLLPIISAVVIVIGNLLVGKLMERKPTMAGKARPLILIGMPVIAAALLIMFLVPMPVKDANNFATFAMVAVGYNLFYALAWPIYYTSHSALVNLSTRDSGKRGLLSTCIMAAQLGASGVAGMAGGILVDLLGLLPKYSYIDLETGKKVVANALTDIPEAYRVAAGLNPEITPEQANEKWVILMVIMIVALVLGCFLEYFFSRERITEENIKAMEAKGETAETAKKATMAEQIKICVHDKYWWIIIIFFFLYQFGGMMKNNDMSFYSQAMTGGNSLSSLINTVGAVPTALGMAIVWPIAAKIGKKKTIIGGGFLALAGAAVAFIGLNGDLNKQVIFTFLDTDLTTSGVISVGSFIVKALGTAPAMYIALSVMSSVLDHQEAVHGIRTDGFTMAVYGSIMVAMSGVCNGIIVGLNSIPGLNKQVLHTILAFGVEGICYLIMAVLFFGMNIEKFQRVDVKAINADQKAEILAQGGTWVEPEVRAQMEAEENERLVEEARINQLRIDCEKKNLNFDDEEAKYQAAKAEKEAAEKAKKDALEAKKAEKEAAMTEEQKAAREAKAKAKAEKEAAIDADALKELNADRVRLNRPEIAL